MKRADKQKSLKICIHCLRQVDFTEDDHVFPKSWYPVSTPSTVQRWTAPSCTDCNRKLGQLESDLLIRLVPCIDPESPAILGLYDGVSRALGIDVNGLPAEQIALREEVRQKLRSELLLDSNLAEKPAPIPGLESADGEWGVLIPYAALSIMAEKIARGCEYQYRRQRRFVKAPYSIRTLIRRDDSIPEPFASACTLIDFGPGCNIKRLQFVEDSGTVWYFIRIWSVFNMLVRIELEAELLKAEKAFRKPEGFLVPGRAAEWKYQII